MARIYSKLLGRLLLSTVPTAAFTVPTGHVYVVKWLTTYVTSSGQFVECVHRAPGPVDFTVESTALGGAFSSLNVERHWMLNNGDSLLCYAFVANSVYLSLYGYDLLA